FDLFDTGGMHGASEDPLHDLVVKQGRRAIAKADLIVFLVDGREGLTSGDETIARELHETGLPVVLAVNKIDDKRARSGSMEFYQLGFDPIVEISAEHGTGVGDLLDEVINGLGTRAVVRQPAAPSDDGSSSQDSAGADAARGIAVPPDHETTVA